MEDAEQHYGLMGEYAGASADATPQPGGDPAVWRALPVLARGDSLVLRVGADPSYLYVALAGPPSFDPARHVVGVDTSPPDRGELRMAWGLLNVPDPSSRHVMVRYRRNGTFETAVTDGFRFDVAALDRSRGGVVARLGAGQTYAWPTWEVPTWHERLKPAYEAMREVWGSW